MSQDEYLVLIGSTNYDYVAKLQSYIQNQKVVWSAWDFRIREQWRNAILGRLKTQGKFPIFFYMSKNLGGTGEVEYVGVISDILIGDTPSKTPNPDLTPEDELHFPTDTFKTYTWFKFSEIQRFGPVELGAFRDIGTEDPIVPSQLRRSFAYASVPEDIEERISEEPEQAISVSVERDLRKYLVVNLDSLEPSLRIHQDGERTGEEFPIAGGSMRIDILAVDKSDKFVVIELKAGVADTSTFGQISGYIGWIKKNLAKGREVRGMLVANSFDEKVKYATALVPDISLKRYELKFEFKDVNL